MESWIAMGVVLVLAGAFVLGARWLLKRLDHNKVAPPRSVYIYDKAEYHKETIEELGLPGDHACHPAAFFLSWLIKTRLTSREFERGVGRELTLFRKGKMSIQDLYYQRCDGSLASDMLSEEGNAFAQDYLDYERGKYVRDYKERLQRDLPSEFHVAYTPENVRLIHEVFDRRYREWQEARRSAAGSSHDAA